MDDVRTHTQSKFPPERYFWHLFWSLHGRVFPQGWSFRRMLEVDHSGVHSNYMKIKIRKNFLREQDESYLILTQLKWWFVSFSTHPPLCKTYFLLTYFKIYFACGKPFQFFHLFYNMPSWMWRNFSPYSLSVKSRLTLLFETDVKTSMGRLVLRGNLSWEKISHATVCLRVLQCYFF